MPQNYTVRQLSKSNTFPCETNRYLAGTVADKMAPCKEGTVKIARRPRQRYIWVTPASGETAELAREWLTKRAARRSKVYGSGSHEAARA